MRYLGIMFSVICFICSISLASARYYDVDGNNDFDGDGIIDLVDMDDDNDGIPDDEDNDDDNDGILDSEDDDDDNDGIPDSVENDFDNDGIPDDEDNDDDNDGIPDSVDEDDDNDGVPDSVDEDDDNDGIPDYGDNDDDNDGIPDSVDEDDDNDGIPDYMANFDNDGILDCDDDDDDDDDCTEDNDCDGDDIPDSVDLSLDYNYEEYYNDLDYDGISDDEDMDDDNDGIPDEEDLDDDNDGVPDVVVDVSDAKEVPNEELPAPPTVQACCPPGSRLRLKSMKNGGYSSQCVNTTSKADVGEEVPELVIVGNTLPQCGRGMQAELVGIKTRETVRAVTTSKPVVVEEVYEEEQFSVEIFSSQIPYGWRLASVSDVRDSSGYVKSAVKSAIASWEYGIACLANDARLLGRGYSHRIEENDTCDGPDDHIGHKVIVKGGRTNQAPRQTTEAPPPAKEYGATLSSSGQLLTADNTFEMEAFCVETTWDEWDSSDWVYNEHSEGGEALALSCDMCREEVLCLYAKMFYDTYSMDRASRAETRTVKALIGEFSNFDEFKKAVETFVKDFWKLVDSDEDGNLGEILKQTEVRISSSFLLKLSKFLFEKFDIDWDDELSALDWFELTGETEGDKNIGRKLISLPSPIYTMYTRLDEDRNEVLSLEELNTFLSRTFAMVDKDEDCLIDMKDVIATLDESELPKDYQLGVKQLVQQQLTIANHAFNRIFEVADKNHDNITEAGEILNFNDFDFLDSELEDTLILSQPNMQVVNYLTGEERDTDTWLETLQNLMMNQVYQLQGKYIKCG